jgi:hypothetical protein
VRDHALAPLQAKIQAILAEGGRLRERGGWETHRERKRERESERKYFWEKNF